MKEVNESVLQEAANKLMFSLKDDEVQRLLIEFKHIIKQMELIGEIENVDKVEPMTFPFDVTNSFLREDKTSEPLKREDALKNAKDVVDGQIRLPKVVG
ncbi:MAG: Asp-tRNA(Asn)/Glu-tRNA(Gln) amidotransferase subunit GatC [Bacilli bacterium]|nr:Asp-tRNA(Asn)/Glu-tRNA(Gln) amidotransferase subunit GatC [Bacilli bacterium]